MIYRVIVVGYTGLSMMKVAADCSTREHLKTMCHWGNTLVHFIAIPCEDKCIVLNNTNPPLT
jgi:hypothetical protein